MGERRHLAGVFFTRRFRDLFRKRYWAECWRCDCRTGPFRSKNNARMAVHVMDIYYCPGEPSDG